VFIMIPQLVILTSLLIDVFVYEEFHYVYMCGPLYLIRLLYYSILNLLTREAVINLGNYGECVKIRRLSTGQIINEVEYTKAKMRHTFNTRDYEFSLVRYNKKTIGKLTGLKFKDETDALNKIAPLTWAYSNAVEVCSTIRTHEEMEMKYVKLGILIGYSVCWGYILIKSMILW
jgi:hypothetical protein